MNSVDLKIAVVELLSELGGRLTEDMLRRDTKECRDAMYADNVAHGGNVEDPFFSFVALDGVAAFTFFESEFSIYAFSCDEAKLISETEGFAMADTKECKHWLAETYDKKSPDLAAPRAVAESWLESD